MWTQDEILKARIAWRLHDIEQARLKDRVIGWAMRALSLLAVVVIVWPLI